MENGQDAGAGNQEAAQPDNQLEQDAFVAANAAPEAKQQQKQTPAQLNMVPKKVNKRDQKLMEQMERLKLKQAAMEQRHKLHEEKAKEQKIRKAIKRGKPTLLAPNFKQSLSNPFDRNRLPMSFQLFEEMKKEITDKISA